MLVPFSSGTTLMQASAPGGSLGDVQASETLAISTPTTPTTVPTNANVDSKTDCGRWYTIQEGDYCDSVSINQGISSKDFYFLNPEINADCTNLLLGLAYCVQAVGSIQTYSGYPTASQYITLTSATYSTTSVNATQPYLLPIPTAAPDLPLASGTISGCDTYRNYKEVADDTSVNQTVTSMLNSCRYMGSVYGVTTDQLLSWNPSLSADACSFSSGSRYCVIRHAANAASCKQITFSNIANRKIASGTLYDSCLKVNETMPGTINTCGCFTTVGSWDSECEYDTVMSATTLLIDISVHMFNACW